MTKNEFLELLKTDTRFNLHGKAITATLYESPLDNLTQTEDGLSITLDGDTLFIPSDEIDAFYADLDNVDSTAFDVVFMKRFYVEYAYDTSDSIPRWMFNGANMNNAGIPVGEPWIDGGLG